MVNPLLDDGLPTPCGPAGARLTILRHPGPYELAEAGGEPIVATSRSTESAALLGCARGAVFFEIWPMVKSTSITQSEFGRLLPTFGGH